MMLNWSSFRGSDFWFTQLLGLLIKLHTFVGDLRPFLRHIRQQNKHTKLTSFPLHINMYRNNKYETLNIAGP